MARTDRLHILLTEDERTALDAAAEREGETVSTLVRRAIREWLARNRNRASPPPPPKRSRR